MVVLSAKIIFHNVYNSEYDYLNNNLKCVLEINKKACEAMVQTLDNTCFIFDEEREVKIFLPTGECMLSQLLIEPFFNLYLGKKIGEGTIKKVLEVYVEKQGLCLLKDTRECLKIVRMAEKMDNALIYEEVYEWLKIDKMTADEY